MFILAVYPSFSFRRGGVSRWQLASRCAAMDDTLLLLQATPNDGLRAASLVNARHVTGSIVIAQSYTRINIGD
jgi:hypothetical protein